MHLLPLQRFRSEELLGTKPEAIISYISEIKEGSEDTARCIWKTAECRSTFFALCFF